MAELADALDLGSSGRKVVEVQVLSPALFIIGLSALVERVALHAGASCWGNRASSNTEQLHVFIATAKGACVDIVPIEQLEPEIA